MKKRILFISIIIIGVLILIGLLIFIAKQQELQKVSRFISTAQRGNIQTAEITHADYLVANNTSEVIEVRRKTFTDDGRTRLDSTRIDPGKMIQIHTTDVAANGDTSPANIFSDFKILTVDWSEDVLYFGLNNDDWKSFPGFDTSRKRYALFIGPEISVISPKDCSKKYDDFGVKFTYPCTWELLAGGPGGVAVASPREWFTVYFPAPNFEEHEDKMTKNFKGQFSVTEKQIKIGDTVYPGKEFGHHGGLDYVFYIDGEYVGVRAEGYLDENSEALKMIFGSLEF